MFRRNRLPENTQLEIFESMAGKARGDETKTRTRSNKRGTKKQEKGE